MTWVQRVGCLATCNNSTLKLDMKSALHKIIIHKIVLCCVMCVYTPFCRIGHVPDWTLTLTSPPWPVLATLPDSRTLLWLPHHRPMLLWLPQPIVLLCCIYTHV